MKTAEQKIVTPRVPNTIAIIELFRSTAIGELITHDQISFRLGMPLRRWISSMAGVQKELEEKHSMRLILEPGSGYRRVDAASVPGLVDKDERRMRRIAKRSLRRIGSVSNDEYQQLTPDQKGTHERTASLAAMRYAMLSDTKKKLSTAVVNGKEKPRLPDKI